MLKNFVIFSVIFLKCVLGDAGTDYNEVNTDGSFAFGLSNDDIGGYYHTATGSPNKIIRGRYGSRNPASGRIEETVYTAGPRGFRARGPAIHRHMDLSQYPRGPIGSPDDPLADPYEDPSYDFSFRTSDHERREEADNTGRVRGLYSYLDDIGERHTVRYAAGAETGFEVLNSVPDTPASVAYNSPLYKAPVKTRGRMSVQRGPDGQYKFILSGPDQRRSETRGPDEIVRGSYSYLDDKGIQRTVQYIAGPGIGYRVVKNVIGPGTHVNPAAAAALPPTYGIRDFQTNDLNDDGFLRTAESGRIRPKDESLDALDRDKDSLPLGPSRRPIDDSRFSDVERPRGQAGGGRRTRPLETGRRPIGTDRRGNRPNISLDDRDFKDFDSSIGGSRDDSTLNQDGGDRIGIGRRKQDNENNLSRGRDGGIASNSNLDGKSGVSVEKNRSRGNSEIGLRDRNYDGYANGYDYGKDVGSSNRNKGPNFSSRNDDDFYDFDRRGQGSFSSRGSDFEDDQYRNRGLAGGNRGRRPGIKDGSSRDRIPIDRTSGERIPDDRPILGGRRRPGGSRVNTFEADNDSDFPLITSDRRRLELDRDRDWSSRGRDSTVIKNVGKWYVGLPPGSAVRAHVQSIDLLPLGGRAVAPSEALLRDEIKATRQL